MKKTGFVVGIVAVIAVLALAVLPTTATVAPDSDLQMVSGGPDGIVMAAKTCGPRRGECKPGGTTCRCEP